MHSWGAAHTAGTDTAWWQCRSFAIDLHNDHEATAAALFLTDLAINQAERYPFTSDVLEKLIEDKKLLRKNLLLKALGVAHQVKNRGRIRALLNELVEIIPIGSERTEYTAALDRLNREAASTFTKWGIAAVICGIIMYGSVNTSSPSPSSPQWSNVQAPATYLQPSGGEDATADIAELQPNQIAHTLSRSELRWCLFEDARLQSGTRYIENLRAANDTSAAAFNAGVEEFNKALDAWKAVCPQQSYYRSDESIVKSEQTVNADKLQNEGVALVADAIQAAGNGSHLSATQDYTNSTTAPPTATPSGPHSTESNNSVTATSPKGSAAFTDGQNDRSAWESWIGQQSGDFRAGAEWWASVRSLRHHPDCRSVPTQGNVAIARSGCNEARLRLSPSDRRRRSEPDYRSGWNSPPSGVQ